MARGWESKAVASQMEEACLPRAPRSAAKRQRDEIQRQAKLRSLELSRLRTLNELNRCQNERFRALLEAELTWLEQEIRKYQA